jgi:hypothetical protein
MTMPDSTAAANATTSSPSDAVVERLNDPGVAAALVTLLDNAELLSTLVLGLGGFMERGDMIMDAVAEGVNDFKSARAEGSTAALPSVSELGSLAGELNDARPALQSVLSSSMLQPETIALLSDLSEAATEGAANARANDTRVGGIRNLVGLLRDPEVGKGLGLLVEISRSLGKRMG